MKPWRYWDEGGRDTFPKVQKLKQAQKTLLVILVQCEQHDMVSEFSEPASVGAERRGTETKLEARQGSQAQKAHMSVLVTRLSA
jgi:hypothetical protein